MRRPGGTAFPPGRPRFEFEDGMKTLRFTRREAGFLIGTGILALLVRGTFFPFVSTDFRDFLSLWFDTLRQNGGLGAIGLAVGDYSPPYIYLLALLTYLPLDGLHAVKLLSCAADLVLALYAMRIVWQVVGNKSYALLAWCGALFLPTVLINSAVWAQCDAIYTAGLLACLYYFLREDSLRGMLAFSLALAFKLQAVFLAPLLLALLLKGRLRPLHLLLPPAVYLLGILPAALMGRDFGELLTIYLSQAGSYQELSMMAPNPYSWLNGMDSEIFAPAGILLLLGVTLIGCYFLVSSRVKLSERAIVSLALLSVLLAPYLLPHMHERYFYAADLLSLIYWFCYPRRWYVPLGVVGCSSYVVCNFVFSFDGGFLRVELLAVVLLVVTFLLLRDTVRELRGEAQA